MKGYIYPTDYDWFTYLRALAPPPDEVNFWLPGTETTFRALEPGAPFFLKLKGEHNAIGGFGFFAHFIRLPISMAWEVYGQANGAATFEEFRQRLSRLRGKNRMEPVSLSGTCGCILLNKPTFFDDADLVETPSDFAVSLTRGRGVDLTQGEGLRMWEECLMRARSLALDQTKIANGDPIVIPGGYGRPTIVLPRLGQKSFRLAVLDSYGLRCAVTGERTLPALEAAHIRRFADVPQHEIQNGIAFRADIHHLFDRGYVTVTPDYHFEVSRRIKEEYENGRDYYRFQGSEIRVPVKPKERPLEEALRWHNENRFLG